jgi:methylamine dehydrogenase accessory protein MauD
MSTFGLVSNLVLWVVVILLSFLLLGALRGLALLRWQMEQLMATVPSRLGRSGLRPGKKAPDFNLPTISGNEVSLHHYANRKLLLVFMKPGCGPCHRIVPELNRLYHAGDVQVLVIQHGDIEAVQRWTEEHRPDFSVALQEDLNLSKRYEIFATPFAFLIDEHAVIVARGIVSTKQYLGFVLTRAGHNENEADREAESSGASQSWSAYADESALSNSKEVDHV